jgi:hypothetical protein
MSRILFFLVLGITQQLCVRHLLGSGVLEETKWSWNGIWRNAKWFVLVEPRRVTLKSHDFSADLYVHINMARKLFLQCQSFYSIRFGRSKICGESGSILSPLFTLRVVVILCVLQPRAISTGRSVLPIKKTFASSLKDAGKFLKCYA